MIVEFGGPKSEKLPDEVVLAMGGGNFYHYMLDKDHYEWARFANLIGGLGLSKSAEEVLATWFANAMCAVVDRPAAGYIRARLDSEAKDTIRSTRVVPAGTEMVDANTRLPETPS